MQLARSVIGDLQRNQLALVVMGFLRGRDRIVTLADGQSNHLVGDPADFLRLALRRLNPAIPDQISHLVAKQRFALVSRATQLALVSHWVVPPSVMHSGVHSVVL